MEKVIKRNGKVVDFDKNKIYTAVTKAFMEVDGRLSDYASNKGRDISNYVAEIKNSLSVEEIQDIVEERLMACDRKDVARAYIRYRYRKEIMREGNTTDKTILELIGGDSEYWNTENSNKNATIVTTQRDYIAGTASTDITRRLLLDKDITEAHDAGIIHFHDADYFAQRMHNCFSGDTKFVTSEGIKTFNSFHSGDTTRVLDKDGNWRDATVKCYGSQSLNLITLKCGRTLKVIKATENHRWMLKDGTITTNLSIGDSLFPLRDTASHYEPTDDVLDYYTYGFILGDGCDSSGGGISARLCGNKAKMLKYFIKSNYQSRALDNGDYYVFKNHEFSKQVFLNNKCWKILNLEQKMALFHGYYEADGFKDRNGIATSDSRLAEMIEDISALAGYHISSKNEGHRKTNFAEDSYQYSYRFRKYQPNNLVWKVEKIEKFDRGRERLVWCVEEPITNTFTLEGGIVTGNCCLINLNDMLQNGTLINGVMIEKPHKFITASTIATQIILGVSSSQYGGCTITLSHLAPFVRDSYNRYLNKYLEWKFSEDKAAEMAMKDTRKEIEAGVQTFNYQVNSMTNTNGQSPFLSVCMYLGETDEYKEELAMIIEEFLKQRIIGFKNRKGVYVTPAFPKLLYVLEEDNATESSPYWYLTELAAKCTAKRLVPDYISEKVMKESKINTFGDGDAYPCMGCRSFLTPWRTTGNISRAKDFEEGKGKYYGRFNQGVVTVNLPDIAFSAIKEVQSNNTEYTHEDLVKTFWSVFDSRMEICHRALRARHDRLRAATSDLAPIMWQNGALARLEPGESIEPLLYDGYSTLSLGYAGLYECVKAITGSSHTDESIGRDFGLEVMKKLNEYTKKWKADENIDYSLYGTPIESTTYKFAKSLKTRFGEDIFKKLDGLDRNYITNSYHVPVFEKIDPFRKLEIESEFQQLSPGGAISYVETADLTNNVQAVLEVIKFIYDNIMYAELNTKSDYCHICGYDGEIKIIDEEGKLGWECPNCGNRDQTKMNIARRVCGYISTNGFNQGRTNEIKDRYVHLDNCEECI